MPSVNGVGGVGYGMGWVLSSYGGLPLVSHDGGTIGFTSRVVLLPGADVGLVLLTNRASASSALELITETVMRRAFGLDAPDYASYVEAERTTDALLRSLSTAAPTTPVAAGAVASLLGDYEGGIRLVYEDETLRLLSPFADLDLVQVMGLGNNFASVGEASGFLVNVRGSNLTITLALDPAQSVTVARID